MIPILNAQKFNSLSWLRHRLFKSGVVFRSTLTLTALAGATLMLPSTSHAALLAYEGFNYSTGSGNLTGLSGGFGWNGVWQTVNNGSSSVQAGSLMAGTNSPVGYDSLSIGNSVVVPNGTRTGRFLDTSAGGSFGANGYLNGSGNVGAAGKTLYISFVQQPNGATSYYEFEFHRSNLSDPGRVGGIGNDSGSSAGVFLRVPNANQTLIGTGNTVVNFFVVRIDFMGGNDKVSVYQNPTSVTESGTPTLVETGAGDMSFNGISFGAFNNGRTVAQDEVRLGQTWADVVSPGAYSAGNWDGGGANGNWSTAANWDNNVVPVFATSLLFAGNTRLNSTNDLTGISANNITFDSAAGAFTLVGNSLGLNGTIVFNGNPTSPITQTIDLPLVPSGSITLDTPTNANLVLGGGVTSSQWLTKIDGGTLTLGGANTFAALSASGGTNIITGNTAFTGGGGFRFYLADGDFINGCKDTLIIQPGATLTVTGNYDDAGVIGRDSGSGVVIQNGGTFNFAISNNPYLFVGASGSTNTRSEYDMNGGLLNLNGETLGIALGANTVITGLVNQVSGVISNVGQLYLDPFFTQGHGIYNLTGGTIYIGAGGITNFPDGTYEMNLGGGTIAASANWSSVVNLNLTGNNGAVTFNPVGNTITLTGILSGVGGLMVSGGGILELSGANTYTGDTAVNAGSILQLDSTGSSAGTLRVANNALLNLNFNGNYAVGSFYTNGVALPIGTYNSGNLSSFIGGSGNIQVVSGVSAGLWKGTGADNNWSTAANWDNNAVPIFPHALTFAGSARLTNNNDLSSITISSLIFDAAAGAFQLNGNDVSLSGNIGFNGTPVAPITQTVNLNMTWNMDKTIDTPTNGNLTLNGTINAAANNFTKVDSGTLTLGGNDSFAGYTLNNGVNIITGTTTINGTGGNTFYLGNGSTSYNGTLVIQPGAALNVTGSFGDAFVIGRNGGSGKVIQNGGAFTFNPANQSYIFVGATSSGGTQAEYDMNGGVLDMSTYTLGIALGDNNTVFTGTLNQTGGSIINLTKLDLGAVRLFGHGVYNLSGGSITIDLGGITSDSGSYQINLGGGTIASSFNWSSSLNMNLTNWNGSVAFSPAAGTITLSGVLSGTGGLIVTNGTLELSGANTYTGDTVVSSGSTLQLDSTGSSFGAFRLVDGAALNLNYSGNYVVAGFYTNGVALPVGTYNAGNLPALIQGSGSLVVAGSISSGTWTGLGANNNWSTAGNWDHNAVPVFPIGLTFAGNTRLANNNDLSSITASSITFDAAAGAFAISGNDIALNGSLGFNGNPTAPITQTVNLNMAWNATQTIDTPANGNLLLNGNITSANGFFKVDVGTLTLGGNNSFAAYEVNGGTNIITGTTTINGTGGGRIYVGDGDAVSGCNGTLVIQPGGTLAFNGNYADAFVLGRDSGSGTIAQNGGLLSFNPGNQSLFLIAATGDSRTRAEYDMNGGVFDMTGKTLGVGFGATLSTGLVNQVSGVITNVGNLRITFTSGNGFGGYTLSGGSIYIGSGGISSDGGRYAINLGGGTIMAQANWSSSLNINLTGNNGSVTFNPAGNIITLSGQPSGTGGLQVAGGGTLKLAGGYNYSGDTTVSAGTLELDEIGSLGSLHIAGGAVLNLNFSGNDTVTAFYTNGVALPGGVYTAVNLPAFITGAGSVTVPGPTAPVVNQTVISGGNLILTGSGGTVGASYTWLTTTNLVTPLALWTTNTTGSFDSNGNFSNAIPVSAATPAKFFRLRTP